MSRLRQDRDREPSLPLVAAGGIHLRFGNRRPSTSANESRRLARLRPGYHQAYPLTYHEHWLRVADGYDADIPLAPGNIRVELAGGIQEVPADHFEIAQRTRWLILVVDDDANIRRTLETVLTRAGYEVIQARDGEEGTALWHQYGPDLIVTDIHMPRKSGLLLIQDLQTHGSTTPIIAMTDGGPAANLGLLSVAKMLGSVRTVPKPYSLDDMVKAVQEELER